MFAKDTLFADWLSWFCAEEEPFRHKTGQPLEMPAGRVATNGRYAVVTNDGGPCLKGTGSGVPDLIAGLLSDQGDVIATMDFAEFKALAGSCDHPWMVTCDKCDGEKRVEHECDCEHCTVDSEKCGDCKGTGKADHAPELRYVTLWGHPFDGNQLAYILEHVPPTGEVLVFVVKKKDVTMLHVIAKEWHALFAGLARGPKDAPELMATVSV